MAEARTKGLKDRDITVLFFCSQNRSAELPDIVDDTKNHSTVASEIFHERRRILAAAASIQKKNRRIRPLGRE